MGDRGERLSRGGGGEEGRGYRLQRSRAETESNLHTNPASKPSWTTAIETSAETAAAAEAGEEEEPKVKEKEDPTPTLT